MFINCYSTCLYLSMSIILRDTTFLEYISSPIFINIILVLVFKNVVIERNDWHIVKHCFLRSNTCKHIINQFHIYNKTKGWYLNISVSFVKKIYNIKPGYQSFIVVAKTRLQPFMICANLFIVQFYDPIYYSLQSSSISRVTFSKHNRFSRWINKVLPKTIS